MTRILRPVVGIWVGAAQLRDPDATVRMAQEMGADLIDIMTSDVGSPLQTYPPTRIHDLVDAAQEAGLGASLTAWATPDREGARHVADVGAWAQGWGCDLTLDAEEPWTQHRGGRQPIGEWVRRVRDAYAGVIAVTTIVWVLPLAAQLRDTIADVWIPQAYATVPGGSLARLAREPWVAAGRPLVVGGMRCQPATMYGLIDEHTPQAMGCRWWSMSFLRGADLRRADAANA